MVAVAPTFSVAGAPLRLMALTAQVGVGVVLLLLHPATTRPKIEIARRDRIETPGKGSHSEMRAGETDAWGHSKSRR